MSEAEVVEKLERVGFTREQALALVEVVKEPPIKTAEALASGPTLLEGIKRAQPLITWTVTLQVAMAFVAYLFRNCTLAGIDAVLVIGAYLTIWSSGIVGLLLWAERRKRKLRD